MRIDRIRGWAALIFLALCLMLGGASGPGAGALGNGFLQGVALILILAVFWTRRGSALPLEAKMLGWIVAGFLLVVLLSLVPLPAWLWTTLSGREPTARGLELLGLGQPSMPASLAPQNSLTSLAWLLPPTAMFLLVAHMSAGQRSRLPWVILLGAAFSVGLGAAQLLSGPRSPLRFYEITNPNLPVGFFSNGNHLATLLLCALPLAGYLAARAATKSRVAAQRKSGIMLAGAVAALLVIGIAVIGSLAGYGLLLPAGAAAFLIFRRAAYGPLNWKWSAGLAVLFLVFVGLAMSGPLTQKRVSEKFAGQPSSRMEIATTTIEAIQDFLPVGSGLGSFSEVYRTYENPKRIVQEYVNHAHNDYLEFALELGLAGIALIILFLLWWGSRVLRVWRTDFEGVNLARAGSVIIGVVLLHSLVDYPLRTSAMAAIFAMACALLVPYLPPPDRKSRRKTGDGESLKHLEAD